MIGTIDNKEEQEYILGDIIVSENRGSASIFDQLIHLKHVLIDMPTTWSIIDTPLKKEYTMLYKDRYGIWSHGTRNTRTHNNLGMAFAWYMLNKKIFNELELSDSPDFHATSEIKSSYGLSQINISGDIGRCTTIEFHYSPSIYYNYKLRTRTITSKSLPFHLNNFTDKELKEIFYCTHCKQWAIQDESLKN